MGPISVSFFSKSFASLAPETPVLKAQGLAPVVLAQDFFVYPVKEIKGFHGESYRMLVMRPGARDEAAVEQSPESSLMKKERKKKAFVLTTLTRLEMSPAQLSVPTLHRCPTGSLQLLGLQSGTVFSIPLIPLRTLLS